MVKNSRRHFLSRLGFTALGIGLAIRAQAQAKSQTYVDFSWTVWHEGVRIYDNGMPGSYRGIAAIRNDALGRQGHNSGAAARIRQASNNTLLSYLPLITDDIFSNYQLATHFRWVAYHEGALDSFRQELGNRNFTAIRDNYSSHQGHNPDAVNLLAGVSNQHISDLIDAL